MEPDDDMDEAKAEMRTLMSGYLDGELEPDEQTRFELYIEEHSEFRRELEEMEMLVSAASDMEAETLPDDVWDTFLENVYNRLERRTGWTLLILGVASLAGLGLYWFVVAPWASLEMKIFAALPVGGLFILFGSVLRERLFMLKTDKYSRDVKR